MKKIEDIKIGDILYAIDNSNYPEIRELKIIDINKIDNFFVTVYNIILQFEDGIVEKIEFNSYNSSCITDYDNPIYINIGNRSYMVCFNKEILYNRYIEHLNNSIKSVEDVISRAKKSLIRLHMQLNSIQNYK